MVEKVVLPNEQFLQKDFVEARILRIMEPELEWLTGFMPQVQSTAKAVWTTKEVTSAKSDAKRRAPRLRTAGSKFVKMSISQLEEVSTTLATLGLQMTIDEDAVRYAEGIDEMQRAYNRAAYWLLDQVNTEFGAALTGGVYQVTGSDNFGGKTTPAWSVKTGENVRDPVEDLMLLAQDMERDEYPYGLTDVYVHKQNYWELMHFLKNLQVTTEEKKAIWGMPDIKAPQISIPVVGNVAVHKMVNGVVEGGILGLDRRFPAGTFYYARNPKYPTTTDNKIGFHINRFEDQETHDTVFQMWLEFGILVKEPYAGIYASTGI